jgi:xanthine dehydrogenase accessory factor
LKELADIVCEFERSRGEPMALATLVRSRGSSYRRPGARMLVTENGRTVGALSGGCLEEEISRRAGDVMRSRTPCLLLLDTRLRFGCNGAIEVFIEPINCANQFLASTALCLSARIPFTAATIFDSRDAALPCGTRVLRENDPFFDQIRARHADICALARTFEFSSRTLSVLVQPIQPPIKLIAVGGGPESVALAAFSSVLGWQFIEATHPSDIRADHRTAVVVKTHNYGRDFAFLQCLLPLDLRYIGILGPKQRRDQLLCDLIDRDSASNGLKNLYGPAGLDLGVESPEEIALAIIAEIQSVFHEGSRKSLRDHRGPIHVRAASEGEKMRCRISEP